DTNPPSNPELLEALARDFRDSGFDQKHLLRRIVNSQVYQLESDPVPDSPADNTFYTFHSPKRLMAEQLLDAIVSATGVPDKFAGLPKTCGLFNSPIPRSPRTSWTRSAARAAWWRANALAATSRISRRRCT